MTRLEAAGFLQAHDNYLILTHTRPDGDTLGSAALLCRGLRQLGKTAHLLQNPETTPKYTDLVEGLTIPVIPRLQSSRGNPFPEPPTVIAVDVASEGMLQKNFSGSIHLRIDHHRTGSEFSQESLVDPVAAACGQLIYDLLTDLGVALDEPMAIALYTAISTDTGCFRFANTQSHTLEVAAKCAEVITDLYSLNQQLFGLVSLTKLKLQSWLLEHAIFLQNNQVAICPLPLEVERQLGITEDDTENLSGYPRSIEGVKIAATLRETGDGQVKISLRAVPDYDAGAICAKLGGGGHRGAAGASVTMTLEEATQALIAALPEL